MKKRPSRQDIRLAYDELRRYSQIIRMVLSPAIMRGIAEDKYGLDLEDFGELFRRAEAAIDVRQEDKILHGNRCVMHPTYGKPEAKDGPFFLELHVRAETAATIRQRLDHYRKHPHIAAISIGPAL